MINGFHTQPVASIDERSSPLRFLDKIAKEVRLIRIIQTLDTTFGDDTAVICLRRRKLVRKEEVNGVAAHTHNRVIDDELLRPQVALAGLLLL